MKNLKKALNELEEIINSKMAGYNIPENKGNSLRIGNMIVRNSNRFGYIIIDASTNKSIDNAQSKHGAVALANAYIKKLPTNEVKRCDEIIAKNVNDSYFYVNSINHSADEIKQSILEARLEIAQHNIAHAKCILDSFILKHIR